MIGQDENALKDKMPEVQTFDAEKLEKLMQADEKARLAVLAYQLSEDFGKLL